MRRDEQKVRRLKCRHVALCMDCGYAKCYYSLLSAESAALEHSRQKKHVIVGAFDR